MKNSKANTSKRRLSSHDLLRFALISSLTLVCSSCNTDAEVLVSVKTDAASSPTSLRVLVHNDDQNAPLSDTNTATFSSLPQTFLVQPGAETSGSQIRLHVRGASTSGDVLSGDQLIKLPDSGREETSVTLGASCAARLCPRMQACVPETMACNRACLSNEACAGLVGCSSESTCDGSTDTALGTCSGQGADNDKDGQRSDQCPLDTSSQGDLDCDDTSELARVNGQRACGSGRDHDCDGFADEQQLCPSACSGVISQLRLVSSSTAELGATLTALGLMRSLEDDTLVVVGTDTSLASYRLMAATLQATEISSLPSSRVNQVVVSGSTVAAATDSGLLVAHLSADGTLVQASATVQLPEPEPAPLQAVVLQEQTAWVSGDGIGLAAIDLRKPSAPAVLGSVEGPAANDLVRNEARVYAAASDNSQGALWVYPAEASQAPQVGADISEAAGVSGATVTAMTIQPGRQGLEQSILALGVVGETSSTLRLVEEVATDTFQERDSVGGLTLIAGIFMDEGSLIYVTSSGATIATQRADTAGALGSLTAVAPGGSGASSVSVWATSDSSRQPIAAVARGTTLTLVRFSCE